MTGSDPASLRELAAAYALGSLDPDAARLVESMLRESPDLAREVAEYREVAALLARGQPAAQPDPALRARVLERVARERRKAAPRPTMPPRRWSVGLAWAAAAMGVAAAAIFALEARSRSREATLLRATLEQALDTLAARDRLLETLLSPATVSFTLTGQRAAPQPSVAMFWNREQNVWALHATALSPTPAGRAYQLWFLRGAEAIPAGTFETSAEGQAVVVGTGPPDPRSMTATAVTQEPAGGSPQPTSTPILVGTVPQR